MDVEKQINKYVKTFDGIYNYEKEDILNGKSSYLNCKYGISVDKSEKIVAFRAEHDFSHLSHSSCIEQDKINEEAEKQFWLKVHQGEIEYKDVEELNNISVSLKKGNKKCLLCKIENGGICQMEEKNKCIDERNKEIDDNKKEREERKLKNSGDIDAFHEEIMSEIRNAVNNNGSIFRSYSKYLAAPLFKYFGVLYVNRLVTNSVDSSITTSFFDWFDHFDANGNKLNRYYEETEYINVPIKYLASKKFFFSYISQIYDLQYKDVDEMEFTIHAVTIDVSNIDRNCLDEYYNDKGENWFKRYASYRKDKEVLTTDENPIYIIKNKKMIQLIRFIYLLKISSLFTLDIELAIQKALNNEENELSFIIDDKEAFSFIYEYLCDFQNIQEEKEQFKEIMKKSGFEFGVSKLAVREFLNNAIKNSYAYRNLFENNFLKQLIQVANLELL